MDDLERDKWNKIDDLGDMVKRELCMKGYVIKGIYSII